MDRVRPTCGGMRGLERRRGARTRLQRTFRAYLFPHARVPGVRPGILPGRTPPSSGTTSPELLGWGNPLVRAHRWGGSRPGPT